MADPWILYVFIAIGYVFKVGFFVANVPVWLATSLLPLLVTTNRKVYCHSILLVFLRFLLSLILFIGWFSPLILSTILLSLFRSKIETWILVLLYPLIPLIVYTTGAIWCKKWKEAIFGKPKDIDDRHLVYSVFTCLLDPILLILSIFNTISLIRIHSLFSQISDDVKKSKEVNGPYSNWRLIIISVFGEVVLSICSIPFLLLLVASVHGIPMCIHFCRQILIYDPSVNVLDDVFLSSFSQFVVHWFMIIAVVVTFPGLIISPHRLILFILDVRNKQYSGKNVKFGELTSSQISDKFTFNPTSDSDKESYRDFFFGNYFYHALNGYKDFPVLVCGFFVLFSWRCYHFIKFFFYSREKSTATENRTWVYRQFILLMADILVFPCTFITTVTVYRLFWTLKISNKSDDFFGFHKCMVISSFLIVFDFLIAPLAVINLFSWNFFRILSCFREFRQDLSKCRSSSVYYELNFGFYSSVISLFFSLLFDIITVVICVPPILSTIYRIYITIMEVKTSGKNWRAVLWSTVARILAEIPFIIMGIVVLCTWRSVSLVYQLFFPPKVDIQESTTVDCTPSAPDFSTQSIQDANFFNNNSVSISASQRCFFAFNHFRLLFLDVLVFPFIFLITLTAFRLPMVVSDAREKVGYKCKYLNGWMGWHLPTLRHFFALIFDLPFIIVGLPVILSWRRKSLLKRVATCPTPMKARLAVLVELLFFVLDIPAFILIFFVFITRWRWESMKMAMAEGKYAGISSQTSGNVMEMGNNFSPPIVDDERNLGLGTGLGINSRWHSCVYHESWLWLIDILIFFLSLPLRISCWRGALFRQIYDDEDLTESQRNLLIAKQFALLLFDLPVLLITIVTCIIAPWRISTLIEDIKQTSLKEGIHSPLLRQFYEAVVDFPHVFILLPLTLWRLPVTVFRAFYDDLYCLTASRRRVLVWKEVGLMFCDLLCFPLFVVVFACPWRYFFVYKEIKKYKKGDSEHKIVVFEFIYTLMDIPLLPILLVSLWRLPFFLSRLIDTNMSGVARRKSMFRILWLVLIDCLVIPPLILTLASWRCVEVVRGVVDGVKKVLNVMQSGQENEIPVLEVNPNLAPSSVLSSSSPALTTSDGGIQIVITDMKADQSIDSHFSTQTGKYHNQDVDIDYASLNIHHNILIVLLKYLYDILLITELLFSFCSLLSLARIFIILKAIYFKKLKKIDTYHHAHSSIIQQINENSGQNYPTYCEACMYLSRNLDAPTKFSSKISRMCYYTGCKSAADSFEYSNLENQSKMIAPFLVDTDIIQVLEVGIHISIHNLFAKSFIYFIHLILLPFKFISLLLHLCCFFLFPVISFISTHLPNFVSKFLDFVSSYSRKNFRFYSMEFVLFWNFIGLVFLVYYFISWILSILIDVVFYISTFGAVFGFKSVNSNLETMSKFKMIVIFALNFLYLASIISVILTGFYLSSIIHFSIFFAFILVLYFRYCYSFQKNSCYS
ncbi:hypothetical protein RCL1_003633 [Eukaryota sp. TZLM3-RCL]